MTLQRNDRLPMFKCSTTLSRLATNNIHVSVWLLLCGLGAVGLESNYLNYVPFIIPLKNIALKRGKGYELQCTVKTSSFFICVLCS